MKRILNIFCLIITANMVFAQEGEIDQETINQDFHEIIANMPTPMEELEDLHHDRVKFNEHLLCSPANLKLHETDAAIAINCGIYMVDFSYLAVFHKQEKMMEYRALAHELAFRLDAAAPFHKVLSINLEKKVKDHEELKKTLAQALFATEEFLIDSNDLATASQLLLGTWIETQYILLQSFIQDKKPSEAVKTHIKDQQVHLANLIKLVHEFKDEAGMHNELEKLNMLEASFLKIHNLEEVSENIVMELKDEITRLRMDITAME